MKGISIILLCAAVACAADFTTGQAARAVIGQPTFTQADPNSSNTIIGAASGIAYAANTLFVADDNRMGASPENNRVLVFQNLSNMLPPPTADLPYNTKCPVCVGQASIVLGQPDFNITTTNIAATRNSMRQPTAVASDGVHLVVADTNHNRILIWNSLPTVNNAPADVVIGQPDFTTNNPPPSTPTATTLRGPQGVWILNGKLYIADTQNNRVLIYNSVPTKNGSAADVVLGAPNFTTFVQQDVSQTGTATSSTASNMLNPVAVTSDGVHLFVTDLGYNRVLIWKSIPSSNGAPADVVIGQPDMTSSAANNAFTGTAASSSTDTTNKETPVLCSESNGTDPANNPTYPNVCNATLNFPRFALSDGTRLFIADGGNDRVIEFTQIPTSNGTSADTILGQLGGTVDQATDAVDSMNTPTGLAFDGTNLYVSDPYNRRITVYTVAPNILPYQAVVNSASLSIIANGTITIGGTIHDGDVITVTINSAQYTYKVQATDAFSDIVQGVVNSINNANNGSGDPNVLATPYDITNDVVLTARVAGDTGNNITYSTTLSSGAQITATAAGANLTGGGGAAKVAPGTLVSINGANLASGTCSADLSKSQLPTQLCNAQVYFNGIKSPLLFVSPMQVNAQVPWEFTDTSSVNAYVRSVMGDGSISVTSPVAVTIVPANPGIFTSNGSQAPQIAVATHGSSFATAIVSVDGSANPGDVGTVTIQDRSYNYTVQSGDTLDTIRDNLIALINTDLAVSARAAGVFDRIIITARVAGPEGNSIAYGATQSSGAQLVMTPITANGQLCCANVAGAPITQGNPAVPDEVITVYATGLGLPILNDTNSSLISTGVQYPQGAPPTQPTSDQFVSSLAGGSTADVLSATLMPGSVGMFRVDLHLNSGLSTNQYTALTIAQSTFVSNSVTIPVVKQQ